MTYIYTWPNDRKARVDRFEDALGYVVGFCHEGICNRPKGHLGPHAEGSAP